MDTLRLPWRPALAALFAAAAAMSVVAGCRYPGGTPHAAGSPPPSHAASSPAPAASPAVPSPTSSDPPASDGPARFAPDVRRYATAAGIDPQLLMAILYNESYKPHDPALERAWQRIHPDAAFGVANMHRAAFEDTRRGRDFADRRWEELPDDPGLAIEAAAWYLHDLAAQLPARWPGRYSRDELLGLGYNAGPASMTAFARGERPGTVAQSYLDQLHANWDAAARALS